MYYDPSGHIAISTIILLACIGVGALVGGTYAGVTAYNEGARGWELVGWAALGTMVGGAVGGLVGYYAGPMAASLFGSSGGFALVGGLGTGGVAISGTMAGSIVTVGAIGLTYAGSLAASGLMMMAYDGQWPGDDPSKAPDGFEWRGNGAPGSSQGNWYNPETGEILHPDLHHPQPIGPHWDFRDILRQWWRIFKNGKFPK